MTTRDLVESLAHTLEAEAAVLRELDTALRERRRAFVSLRGSALAAGLDAVAALTHRALAAARRRESVLADLASALALRGQARISTLLPHVPAELRSRLAAAAEAVRVAATACGLECRVGNRLLELSHRCLQSLLPSARAETGARVYDQRARAHRPTAATGSFVRGMI